MSRPSERTNPETILRGLDHVAAQTREWAEWMKAHPPASVRPGSTPEQAKTAFENAVQWDGSILAMQAVRRHLMQQFADLEQQMSDLLDNTACVDMGTSLIAERAALARGIPESELRAIRAKYEVSPDQILKNWTNKQPLTGRQEEANNE